MVVLGGGAFSYERGTPELTLTTCHPASLATPSPAAGPTGMFSYAWKGGFKLPWREDGPPNDHDDKVDSDQ